MTSSAFEILKPSILRDKNPTSAKDMTPSKEKIFIKIEIFFNEKALKAVSAAKINKGIKKIKKSADCVILKSLIPMTKIRTKNKSAKAL